MRAKETIVIPETSRVITKLFCDIPGCAQEAKEGLYGWGKKAHKCIICDRDICKRHTVPDPDDNGDYPDQWCTICNQFYYQKRRAIEQKYDKQIEELLKKVKEESLEQVTA